MAGPNFCLTNHAVDQFRERVGPSDISHEMVAEILAEAAPRAVRMKDGGRRHKSTQWYLPDLGVTLCCKRDAGRPEWFVLTILSENETVERTWVTDSERDEMAEARARSAYERARAICPRVRDLENVVRDLVTLHLERYKSDPFAGAVVESLREAHPWAVEPGFLAGGRAVR